DLFGIVNGVDYEVWDPAKDPHLAGQYDADTVAEGKPVCKAALQRRFDLPEEPRTPLFGMVARLVDQKGLELIAEGGEDMLRMGAQLVVLGDGDRKYQQMLKQLR